MAKVVVLGAGAMGTAITIPLADNEHDVRLVGTHLDTDIIEGIHESRRHPKLRARVPNIVQPYTISGLDEALPGADLIILGVNSLGIRWAADILAPVMDGSIPVAAVTKGLEGDGRRFHILPDVFRAALPGVYRDRMRIAAIGGPSIAGELSMRRHTSIVLAGRDIPDLEDIAALLRRPYYHIWTSTDLIGVEICVALKNLYALGVGLASGLLEREGFADAPDRNHNFASALFAQALNEIVYLVGEMGGDPASVYALPGAGDLYTTSQGGRNVRMGRYLGLGMSLEQAKSRFPPGETIEGAELAFAVGTTVENLVEVGDIDKNRIPLLLRLLSIVRAGDEAVFPWDSFFLSA